jgi:hypothetical protein
MGVEKKILEELNRYNQINSYITEQADPLADLAGGADETPATNDLPDAGAEEVAEPVDVASDPEVEVIGDEGGTETESETEELDITDLVNKQNEVATKQDEYMSNLFGKLEDLTNKLGEMDKIFDKINSLEQKIEKYREKTPEERLHLRSLDSYPYNQKLTDFFVDKQPEMEKSGKHEYVLTADEVKNFSDNSIRDTFGPIPKNNPSF